MTEGTGNRLIFVVGCPRSGTTWVERLLATHAAVTSFPGGESRVLADVAGAWELRRETAQPEVVLSAVRRFLDRTFESARARSTAPAARWLVEKTPAHVRSLELAGTVYPDAAVLHVVRDGRDVARSLREFDYGFDRIEDAAQLWRSAIAAATETRRHVRRFFEVRYEELHAAPVDVMTALFEDLGLDVDAQLLRSLHTTASTRVSQLGTTGEVGPGKWRLLDPRDLRRIHAVAGEELARLGYIDRPAVRRVSRRTRTRDPAQ